MVRAGVENFSCIFRPVPSDFRRKKVESFACHPTFIPDPEVSLKEIFKTLLPPMLRLNTFGAIGRSATS